MPYLQMVHPAAFEVWTALGVSGLPGWKKA
jgi:hypothetical protein